MRSETETKNMKSTEEYRNDVTINLVKICGELGHIKETVEEMISRRQPDYKRFIQPQAERADVVFSLMPVNPDLIDKLNLKVRSLIRNGIYSMNLFAFSLVFVDCMLMLNQLMKKEKW